MISFPNAKINLGLWVTEKRKDGFHNLESLFYPVEFCDILEINESDKTVLNVYGNYNTGENSRNLCLKAYNLLCEDFKLPFVKIQLIKKIPVGSGLGGGSSDAVSTLLLLNNLFNLNLSKTKLSDYAGKLGSDCFFFLHNKPSVVTGRGEKIKTAGFSLKGLYCSIFFKDIQFSTAEAYKKISAKKRTTNLISLVSLPIAEWKSSLNNDFEEVFFATHPEFLHFKNSIYACGADYVSLTGSGSAIFSISAKKILFPLEIKKYEVFSGILG